MIVCVVCFPVFHFQKTKRNFAPNPLSCDHCWVVYKVLEHCGDEPEQADTGYYVTDE